MRFFKSLLLTLALVSTPAFANNDLSEDIQRRSVDVIKLGDFLHKIVDGAWSFFVSGYIWNDTIGIQTSTTIPDFKDGDQSPEGFLGIRLGEAIDGPIARWNPDTIDRYQNASLSDREQQKLKEQASLIRDRIGSALKSDILNNTTRIQADFGEDGLSSIKARIIDRYRKYLPRFGLTDTEHERLVHIYTKEILQRLSERGIKAKNDELESHKEKLQETSEKLASVGARFKDYVEQEISDEPFDLEQLQKKLDKKRAEIRSQRQQEHSEILAKAEFRRQLRNLRDALREAPVGEEYQENAREIGLTATHVSLREHARGNQPEANMAMEIGKTMLDVTLGATPFVGTARDIYEVFSGQNMVTGDALSVTERSLSLLGAIAGFASGGMLNSGIVKSGIKVFRKISVSLAKKFSIFQPLTRKVTDKARAISIYLDRRPFYDFVRQIPGVEHLGDGVFRSREGLIYKFQPYRKRGVENSLEHTYKKHALDATVTSGSRFNVNSKELPKLLDEAWATIKRKNIQKQISPSGNKFYELDLKRVIGTNRQTKIKIIVDKNNTNELITAFPIKEFTNP